jgi:acyl-CoA synthetase (AMP-forming)/AMP-acid ligase II
MTTSIASAFDWWARTKGERAAVVLGDDTINYGAYRDWTGRVARRLADAGVSPGDRVAVLGGNTLEWVAAAVGVIKAGAVLVPLNPRLVAAELRKLLSEAGASVVITDAAHLEALKDVESRGVAFATMGMDAIAGLRAGGPEPFRIDRAPHEPVALLFTSGSTGLSKGVICTNRSLLDIVFENLVREEGLGTGSSTLLLLPLCFTPGLVYGLIMTGVLGGTLVVEADLDPARAVRLLDQHQIQVIFGVPLIYEVMARTPEFASASLERLTYAIVGGASVPVPMLEAWGAKGVRLRQIYGMTEAGGVATATLPEEAAEHPDSCGIGSVFTDLKVVRPDGTECDADEPGEIIIRGPGVSPGYWQDPETTARAFADGWLHSGDLGSRDKDGRITFLDRLKDLIITGGINVSPVEIEAVISGIPGVAEVAVIAARDERFGETPAAIVSVTGDVDEAAIVAACSRQLADYKIPRYVVIRPEPLPRLPSGKLSKTELRRQYPDISRHYPRVR